MLGIVLRVTNPNLSGEKKCGQCKIPDQHSCDLYKKRGGPLELTAHLHYLSRFSKIMFVHFVFRACLSAPWKGAELQWESEPTRQLSLQPVAAEASMEAMKCSKPLV